MLSAAARRRLLGALNLLSSPTAGERDAAATAAARILDTAGTTWAEVIPEPQPRHEPHGGGDWRVLAEALLRWHAAAFNGTERGFLLDIADSPRLSPKQQAWLQHLAERAHRAARAA